jgi:hypothetical protein
MSIVSLSSVYPLPYTVLQEDFNKKILHSVENGDGIRVIGGNLGGEGKS